MRLLLIFFFLACFSQPAFGGRIHQWDHEHYANGQFKVKKRSAIPKEKEKPQIQDERTWIDHRGHLYRESEYPQPRTKHHPQ